MIRPSAAQRMHVVDYEKQTKLPRKDQVLVLTRDLPISFLSSGYRQTRDFSLIRVVIAKLANREIELANPEIRDYSLVRVVTYRQYRTPTASRQRERKQPAWHHDKHKQTTPRRKHKEADEEHVGKTFSRTKNTRIALYYFLSVAVSLGGRWNIKEALIVLVTRLLHSNRTQVWWEDYSRQQQKRHRTYAKRTYLPAWRAKQETTTLRRNGLL
jgi:hypothetical protein